MNVDIFVQNVQSVCKLRGTTPTVACSESGAGKGMVSNAKRRGVIPSVAKVQLLATYLGVTVSDLLGEKKEPTTVSDDGLPVDADTARITDLLSRATPETKKAMIALLEQLQGK